MPRSSHGIHRIIGARSSRAIPDGTVCGLRGCAKPATHVVLSATSRNYACTAHAEKAKKLGYEVFEGEQKPGDTDA